MRVIIEGTAKEIAELLPNLTQAEVQLETENINSNDQEMQMLQNLVKLWLNMLLLIQKSSKLLRNNFIVFSDGLTSQCSCQ